MKKIQRINKMKSWFFEKRQTFSKIHKEKERKPNRHNERLKGDITTDTKDS